MLSTAEAIARLHAAGWSIGDAAFVGPEGRTWLVTGTRAKQRLFATGATEAEAWRAALAEAEALPAEGHS